MAAAARRTPQRTGAQLPAAAAALALTASCALLLTAPFVPSAAPLVLSALAVLAFLFGFRSESPWAHRLAIVICAAAVFYSMGGFAGGFANGFAAAPPPVTADWPLHFRRFQDVTESLAASDLFKFPMPFESGAPMRPTGSLFEAMAGALQPAVAATAGLGEAAFWRLAAFALFCAVPLAAYSAAASRRLGSGAGGGKAGLCAAFAWLLLQPHHYFVIGNTSLYFGIAIFLWLLDLPREGAFSSRRAALFMALFLAHPGLFFSAAFFFSVSALLSGGASRRRLPRLALEIAPAALLGMIWLAAAHASPALVLHLMASSRPAFLSDYASILRYDLALLALPLLMLGALALMDWRRRTADKISLLLLVAVSAFAPVLAGFLPGYLLLFFGYFSAPLVLALLCVWSFQFTGACRVRAEAGSSRGLGSVLQHGETAPPHELPQPQLDLAHGSAERPSPIWSADHRASAGYRRVVQAEPPAANPRAVAAAFALLFFISSAVNFQAYSSVPGGFEAVFRYSYLAEHGAGAGGPVLSGGLGGETASIFSWMRENPLPFPMKTAIEPPKGQSGGGFLLSLLPFYTGGRFLGFPYPNALQSDFTSLGAADKRALGISRSLRSSVSAAPPAEYETKIADFGEFSVFHSGDAGSEPACSYAEGGGAHFAIGRCEAGAQGAFPTSYDPYMSAEGGEAVLVNGREVQPRRGPSGELLFAVPAGTGEEFTLDLVYVRSPAAFLWNAAAFLVSILLAFSPFFERAQNDKRPSGPPDAAGGGVA